MNTVVLRVHFHRDDYIRVEMPAATTIRYAARRVAEALGYAGDLGDFRLFVAGEICPINEAEIAADCDGVELMLGVVEQRGRG